MFLLDTSVLIALADPENDHSIACHDWFLRHHSEGWATCPIVENGLLRIVSRNSVSAAKESLVTLTDWLRGIRSMPGHMFVPDDISLVDSEFVRADLTRGHQRITDAYLLGLCRRHGLKLATTDRKLGPALAPGEDIVELI